MPKAHSKVETGKASRLLSFIRPATNASLGTMSLLYLAGCSRAPSFNILGSFFPSWIVCGILGIVLTVVARFVFVRTKLEQQLSPLIVVYPCLTAFFTFTLWLIFFS